MIAAAARREVDLREWRTAGALLLGAAAVVPLLPEGVLPSCPLRAATGIPCPLCGMTTSVVAAVHFDVGTALAVAPAGVVLVVMAVGLLAVRRPTIAVPTWALPAALAAMWLWQLGRVAL